MKTILIVLLISMGLVPLDAGWVSSFFGSGSNSGRSDDTAQPERNDQDFLNGGENPVAFMAEYLEEAKVVFDQKWAQSELCIRSPVTENYDLTAWLGKGGTCQVVLGQHRETRHYYAIKIMHRQGIVQRQLMPQIKTEKKMLRALHFPFIMNMQSCYKDNTNVYFVMDYCGCGTLPYYSNEDVIRFYAAQIVLALHYAHYMNIIHQDVKPENVMVDNEGYIKLADFGFATRMEHGRATKNAGTTPFMAPEVLHNKGSYDSKADWWSLGAMIYRMISGRYPYNIRNGQGWQETNQMIQNGRLKFDFACSEELRNLLKNLLEVNSLRRYGIEQVVRHKWFDGINWKELFHKRVPVPVQLTCKAPDSWEPKVTKITAALGRRSGTEEYPYQFSNF